MDCDKMKSLGKKLASAMPTAKQRLLLIAGCQLWIVRLRRVLALVLRFSAHHVDVPAYKQITNTIWQEGPTKPTAPPIQRWK